MGRHTAQPNTSPSAVPRTAGAHRQNIQRTQRRAVAGRHQAVSQQVVSQQVVSQQVVSQHTRRAAPAPRPLWRRTPALPVLVATLALWGSQGATAVDLSSAHATVAQLAAGAASGPMNSGTTGSGTTGSVLSAGTDQVSRSKRDPHPAPEPALATLAWSSSAAKLDAMLGAHKFSEPVIKAVSSKSVAGTWIRPSSGQMSSCFCMRWGEMHEGIDLAAPLGSPIVAVGDGVVIEAGPAEGFGHWIVIQHANGDVSIYGHMYDTSLVSVGEHVVAGQHIANVGTDGEATGPHLHFGIRLGGLNGTYIDPVPWLKARGILVGPYNPNA